MIAFLVSDIESLVASKVGKTDEERDNVERFRNNVKNAGRLVDFYSNEQELKYKIAMAIPKIIADAPRPGWVRADQAENAIKVAGDESGFENIQRQLENLQNVILEKVEQTSVQWEPIPEDKIDELFKQEKNKITIPKLTEEAKKLLVEVASDSVGHILVIKTLEGTEIQTNDKVMNINKIGKEAIIWEEAVKELEGVNLITSVGNRNEVFQITREGYEVAELIV